MQGIVGDHARQPAEQDTRAAHRRAGVALLARFDRGGARIRHGVLRDAVLNLAAALLRVHERHRGDACQDEQKACRGQLVGYAASHLHASSIIAVQVRSTPA